MNLVLGYGVAIPPLPAPQPHPGSDSVPRARKRSLLPPSPRATSKKSSTCYARHARVECSHPHRTKCHVHVNHLGLLPRCLAHTSLHHAPRCADAQHHRLTNQLLGRLTMFKLSTAIKLLIAALAIAALYATSPMSLPECQGDSIPRHCVD